MTVTRINRGIYDVTHNGIRYELERDEYGLWMLYLAAGQPGAREFSREYMQDFCTKRAALASLQAWG